MFCGHGAVFIVTSRVIIGKSDIILNHKAIARRTKFQRQCTASVTIMSYFFFAYFYLTLSSFVNDVLAILVGLYDAVVCDLF